MIASLESVFSALGAWSLVIIFLLVALESSAFLGFVVPGETAVILAGALAAARILNLWLSYGVVITAAIVGDIFGYLLGRYCGDALLARWTFARRHYLAHQAVLEDHFRRWGAMTVIAGRFVAVGRALAPFTAGLSKMQARTFVPMAVAGGILWNGILLSLGYLFGENWRALEHWIASIGAGVLALLGLTLAMLWLWRWLIARETSVERAWYRLLASRPAARVRPALARVGAFARARLSPNGYFGVHLSLGLLAIAALAWAFGAIAHDIFAQDPLVLVDRQVAFLIDDFSAPALDSLMAVVGL
jgi:undecaprenyl-diphosphatase